MKKQIYELCMTKHNNFILITQGYVSSDLYTYLILVSMALVAVCSNEQSSTRWLESFFNIRLSKSPQARILRLNGSTNDP